MAKLYGNYMLKNNGNYMPLSGNYMLKNNGNYMFIIRQLMFLPIPAIFLLA